MNCKRILNGLALLVGVASSALAADGKAVYNSTCVACHGSGVAGAPKFGDKQAWAERIKAGLAALYNSAIGGKNAMPARGGNPGLSETEVKAAVEYMVNQAVSAKAAPAPEAQKPAAPKEKSAAPAAVPAAPLPRAESVPALPVQLATAAEANTFNRLLRPVGKRNLAPPEDGIHDPDNDGTHTLQPPMQAFSILPRSSAGNHVNWVQALEQRKITPRYDRLDPNAAPVVMDLNIVREVKGSMPDVVYPHKQHTEWLDCSNCHPAIFIPQKGANQISMAAILLGQKCGVCHGKVAFPVSECRFCHSKKKGATVGQVETGR